MKEKLIKLGLFVSTLSLYVYSAAPHIPPYRDAGEMVSMISLLGVAHPPGYPLYTLLGRIAVTLIPFGTEAYRLNLFSGVAGALAVVVFYSFLRLNFRSVPSALAALFLSVSHPFWELSVVPEMYSLGALFLALLLWAVFVRQNEWLFGLMMGCALAVRMDLLLLIPLFLIYFYRRKGLAACVPAVGAMAVGCGLFLYLLIRSLQDPWVDWGNPDNLAALFNSLRRKSYGGTLDLLSLSYRAGENFGINLLLYGRHIASSFGWWGAALILAGLVAGFRKRSTEWTYVVAAFVITGPLFIFLANMPPNPHAVAIIEASYLLPNICLAFLLAAGLQAVFSQRGGVIINGILALGILVNTVHNADASVKRNNFYVRDYVENVFRSSPPQSVSVFHEDVQLFSLWEAMLVQNRRPDVSFISTGLSGSLWYWAMMSRWKRAPAPPVSLKGPEGWVELKRQSGSRRVTVGYETDVSNPGPYQIRPRGLLMEIADANEPPVLNPLLLPGLCVFRNSLRSSATGDFFSLDLISDVARAAHQQGLTDMLNGPAGRAEWFLKWAQSMDPTFARPSSDLGYLYLKNNRLPDALAQYQQALRIHEDQLAKAVEYRTLPPVVNNLKSDFAQVLAHTGVISEKMGNVDQARRYYEESIRVVDNPAARYNLAVTYWDRNWDAVIQHLERAAVLDPAKEDLKNYLARARAMRARVSK